MQKFKKNRAALALVLALVLVVITMATATAEKPVLYDRDDWRSGNAEFERDQIECEAEFAFKIDDWDEADWDNGGMDGDYYDENSGNTITISRSDGTHFDWESEYPVCAVIVVGGGSANVFYYDGAYSGEGLYAPINPRNGKHYEISHVTFCFNLPDGEYGPETAYGGDSAGDGSAWWYYFDTAEGQTQTIWAGRNIAIGSVTVEPDGGMVKITIEFDQGWGLQVVDGNVKEESVKIQGYNEGDLPSSRPASGRFTTYKGTELVVTVGSYDYYVIHLDVAYGVFGTESTEVDAFLSEEPEEGVGMPAKYDMTGQEFGEYVSDMAKTEPGAVADYVLEQKEKERPEPTEPPDPDDPERGRPKDIGGRPNED